MHAFLLFLCILCARSFADEYDTYILLSFVGESRVLGMNMEDELDEANIEGIDPAGQVSIFWITKVAL